MLKQLFILPSTVVATAGNYRCCFAPLGVAASAIVACYVFGARVCNIASGHVGFDLVVAVTAVVIHLSLHEFLKRLHFCNRRKM